MLLQDAFTAAAERTPEKTALACDGRRLSYRELDRASNRLAHYLRSRGVRPGDRVAAHLPNGAAAVQTVLATLKAGGVFVLVNPGVKTGKLEHILRDCGAKVTLTSAGHPRPSTGTAFVLDSELDPRIAGRPDTRPAIACGADDLCYLLYTSGSTGGGKGVMMTHRSACFAADAIQDYLRLTADDVLLTFSPLAADYGLYNVLMPLRTGGTAVLERGYLLPRQILDRVAEERVTGLALVPTILALFLQAEGLADHDFRSVRFFSSTGQVLPRAHIARLRELMPHCAIYSMYGLTECKRVSYLDPEQIDARPDSVGKPMAGTEAWLIDDTGARLPRPEAPGDRSRGELVIRGPHIMQGYWNLPVETAARLRRDPDSGEPVLHSGDLFEMDGDGYLYFVSRLDDVIKSAGERISPREIEDCIFALDGVTGVVVTALPDEVLGHAIHARVGVGRRDDLTPDRIRAHCAEHLERALVPRRVEVCAELPLTPTGKLRRG